MKTTVLVTLLPATERASLFAAAKFAITPEIEAMAGDPISGLSKEIQGKLSQTRPETLGQASRIPGVTPAAISLLLIHLKKGRLKAGAATERISDAAA